MIISILSIVISTVSLSIPRKSRPSEKPEDILKIQVFDRTEDTLWHLRFYNDLKIDFDSIPD
jgi:hypothetical protein